MTRVAAACVLLAGCAAAPADEPAPRKAAVAITAVVGQVYVHQFPIGSHAWAAFVADPVALADYQSDQLITLEPPAARREGACALHVLPRCVQECATGSYCAEDETCAPLPNPRYVDRGPISVSGGSRPNPIKLWFDGAVYASDPKPGPVQLFAPGDTLSFAGSDFATTLPGPALPNVHVAEPLHFPTASAYAIRWDSEAAPAIVVNLIASRPDGQGAFIRCATADVGALDVSATLMAGLPPPPRDIRLEVERYEERIIPTSTPGVGVLVRVAQTAWLRGVD